MKQRSIYRHVTAQDIQMGPVTLKQPLPFAGIRQVDPFLLLHHFGPRTQEPGAGSLLDIGAHPHRGFEPVTFIFKGEVHHEDSMGNNSLIKAGGVQWMTAGRGVVHSESTSQEFVEEGGELELIQLWINLPASMKMHEPKYQGFQKDEIPVFQSEDEKVHIQVVAGELESLEGPVQSLTGIRALVIEMKAGGSFTLREAAEINPLLYQLEGKAQVNGESGGTYSMYTYEDDGEEIEIHAESDSRFLYVAGPSINERLATYGPFVMNSNEELQQAVHDYQEGKMGVL